MTTGLLLAALLAIAIGLAHSLPGERYILSRLAIAFVAGWP